MAYITDLLLRDFAKKFAVRCMELFARKTEIPTSLPASGGNADTVGGHKVEVDVPADAQFTDTTYEDMVGASDIKEGKGGLVPSPASGKQKAFLRGDGTWQEIQEATAEDIDDIITDAFCLEEEEETK